MTKLRQIFSLIALTLCLTTSAQTNSTDSSETISVFIQQDTTHWIHNFRRFRNALYKNDKINASKFIDFPFYNGGNDIWYLAYSDNEELTDQLSENAKPFTEEDFDKYFKNIFPRQLVKCLLKIKTDDLYKYGESESPEIKDGNTTCKLYVTFDRANNTIELNLATRTPYKISDTEYETGETNFIYIFQVLENGYIKLERILIAG